jgi:hypothetical protein
MERSEKVLAGLGGLAIVGVLFASFLDWANGNNDYLHCNAVIDDTHVIFRENNVGKQNILELQHPEGHYEKMMDFDDDFQIDSYKIEYRSPDAPKPRDEYWRENPEDAEGLARGQEIFDHWTQRIRQFKGQ